MPQFRITVNRTLFQYLLGASLLGTGIVGFVAAQNPREALPTHVVAPRGRLLRIGAGLTVVEANGEAQLLGMEPIHLWYQQLTPDTQNAARWHTPQPYIASTLRVVRNGLELFPGRDFATIDATTIELITVEPGQQEIWAHFVPQ